MVGGSARRILVNSNNISLVKALLWIVCHLEEKVVASDHQRAENELLKNSKGFITSRGFI
jgi:hypothetical protein